MRTLIALICLSMLAAPAHAQLVIQNGKALSDADANNTSIRLEQPKESIANDDGTGPVQAVIEGTRFPASAITEVNGNAAGSTAAGRSSAEPANTAVRKVVPSDSPLWPTDTVDIFVSACSGMRAQLMGVCSCVIEKLALKMPHNEFLELSEANKVESDPRYISARGECMPRDVVPDNQ